MSDRPAGYRGFRDAGVRLREPVAPGLAAHRPDKGVALLPAIHDFDRAHLVALSDAGWLERSEAARLLRILDDAARRDGVTESRKAAGGGIHSGEYLLIAALGEAAGGRISLARSSADLGAVALRTIERDRLLDLGDALIALRRAVIDAALPHLRTVMPMFAQGQHAQPTTVAHYLAAWANVLERDSGRVWRAFELVNRSPAGAAIGTGSTFGVARARTAELLGFDEPIANTLDAATSHDHVLDVLAVLAVLSNDLARLVDDLMGWASHECRYVTFPDRFCGASSILPQARNPYAPQYIKGVAAAATGALVNGLVVDRAGTGEAVLDRHQLSEQLLGLFGQSVRDVRWLTELVPELGWDADRLEAAARAHWATATDVAGLLVATLGVSWRLAHQITGVVVRLSEERGVAPVDVTTELIADAAAVYGERLEGDDASAVAAVVEQVRAGAVDAAALAAALDPLTCVQRRAAAGGPAPDDVDRQLQALRRRADDDAATLADRRDRLARAREALDGAVRALTGE